MRRSVVSSTVDRSSSRMSMRPPDMRSVVSSCGSHTGSGSWNVTRSEPNLRTASTLMSARSLRISGKPLDRRNGTGEMVVVRPAVQRLGPTSGEPCEQRLGLGVGVGCSLSVMAPSSHAGCVARPGSRSHACDGGVAPNLRCYPEWPPSTRSTVHPCFRSGKSRSRRCSLQSRRSAWSRSAHCGATTPPNSSTSSGRTASCTSSIPRRRSTRRNTNAGFRVGTRSTATSATTCCPRCRRWMRRSSTATTTGTPSTTS